MNIYKKAQGIIPVKELSLSKVTLRENKRKSDFPCLVIFRPAKHGKNVLTAGIILKTGV